MKHEIYNDTDSMIHSDFIIYAHKKNRAFIQVSKFILKSLLYYISVAHILRKEQTAGRKLVILGVY